MADRSQTNPIEGESRIGDGRPNIQGVFYVTGSQAGAGKGSVFAMDAVANDGTVTTYYLFFGSDGKLRTHSSFPTNTNTDGTVVGSQS